MPWWGVSDQALSSKDIMQDFTPHSAESATDRGEQRINLVVIWRTVRKHWATAVATALIIGVSVAFYTLGQTKIYESTSTILFDPNPPRPLGGRIEAVVEMGSGPVWDTREYYETQYQLIQSKRVCLSVVSELGLHRDLAFIQNLPEGGAIKGAPPPIAEEIAAEVLKGRVRVEAVKNSRLAKVTLQDANPERAARILSSLVDTYVAQNLDDALLSMTSATDWLRTQLETLKVDLESNEMALHDYKKHKNMLSVAFDNQSNMLRGEMTQINEALTTVRTHREEVSARVAELRKVSSNNPATLPASELVQSPLLGQLRLSYQKAVADRDALLGAQKGPRHTEVMAAEANVKATRSALLSEVRNIQGAFERDLAVIQRQEAGLSGLFERAKMQALELNLLDIEYTRLRRSKENTEKLYSLVLERTKESDLTRMLRVNNIRIVDRPNIARGPIRPNVPLNIAGGAMIGLVLGIGAAMGRALLDRTIKTPDDVEQLIGASSNFLGLIPEIERTSSASKKLPPRKRHFQVAEQPELAVHQNPTSGIAEASRSIRTNLLFMAPDHPYRTLLVTSAGPNEGKTTVACCIAIAMAQAGKRVALIDCDLRRPRLHRIFGKSSDSGVTTALLDDPLEPCVTATQIENLSVNVAGPIPPNPAEILQSERFKSYLKLISSQYDQVILDSSPLVAVTDAAILSTLVDGTVVVMRAFQTRKELAQHAIRSLTDFGAKIAGVVLNAVNLNRDEYKYAYHYYRRDTYSGRSPEQEHERAAPSAS